MARVAGLFDARLPLVSRALPKLDQRLRRSSGALRMAREHPARIDWVRRMALRPRRLRTGREDEARAAQDDGTPTAGTAMPTSGATSTLVSASAGVVALPNSRIAVQLWAPSRSHARVSAMRLIGRGLERGAVSGWHASQHAAVGALEKIRTTQQGVLPAEDRLMTIGTGDRGTEQILGLTRQGGSGLRATPLQSPSSRGAWWHPERDILRGKKVDARRPTRGLFGAPLTGMGGSLALFGGAPTPRMSLRQASQPPGWGSFAPSLGSAGDVAGELAASTAGSQALSSYAPPDAHAQGHRGRGVNLTGEIIIDGRQLGMVIAREQTRQANLPATRGSAIEAGAIPLYLNNSGSF